MHAETSSDFTHHRLRVALVTNIPAPYRVPVYDALASDPRIVLKVFFCSGREPDREWDIGTMRFDTLYLRERFIKFRGRYIHLNPEIWGALRAFSPEVVITTGFNPTHLLAYAYARLYRAKHVAMTDGTLDSEKTLAPIHRWLRRRVYAKTRSFIGASNGSLDLYRAYGIDEARFFKSHLCANNAAFMDFPMGGKEFDFIFCGRFVALKNPLFALAVAQGVARKLGRRVSISFVGSGELDNEVRMAAAHVLQDVDAVFHGFASQGELPACYAAARIFLFPTQWDPWGVVANEACAAGLPVLVSPAAGSARELVRDGENGFVLPLDLNRWVDAATKLLTDCDLYARFSARSRELVGEYTYANAAKGIGDAVLAAADRKLRPRVVIVQRRLTRYRVPLFNLLRKKLLDSGVELRLIVGDPTEAEKQKNDTGVLPWAVYRPCKYWLDGLLCWQDVSVSVRDSELVIIAQENKLLYNYRLLFGDRNFKLAFWGHGANLQARNRAGLLERWKSWNSVRVDWWFAYSGMSVRLVKKCGFPSGCITNLSNAIDTRELKAQIDSIATIELMTLRRQLDIGDGPVGLFVGSLYKDKRLDFLLKAAARVAEAIPGFHLVVVGDGPLRRQMEIAAGRHEWLRYPGSRQGRSKALYLRLGEIFLNPGLVGLSILDAFVAGIPLVTTDCGIHSPEVEYLVDGQNGFMTGNSIDAYVALVTALLRDPQRLSQLQQGAANSANHYAIEIMAGNFHTGILQALGKQR